MKEIILELNGLNCASCAGKIEKLSRDIANVDEADLDFVSKKLKIKTEKEDDINKIKDEIIKIVNRLEPDVVIIDKNSKSENHSHEHSHDHGDIGKRDVIKLILAAILFVLPYLLKLEGRQ